MLLEFLYIFRSSENMGMLHWWWGNHLICWRYWPTIDYTLLWLILQTHHITVINREKKITIAYRNKSYTPTLLRKFPHYIEDVFALDKDTVSDKCVIHVLDCCKLPWRRVRHVTLETSQVNDFCIIDSTPHNIIITTHTPKQLVQGFSFVTGHHLWNIEGKTSNITHPMKIAVNNNDEIYITDSWSTQNTSNLCLWHLWTSCCNNGKPPWWYGKCFGVQTRITSQFQHKWNPETKYF